MSIQSRFTSSEAVDFEFELPENVLPSRSTLWVSHVLVNFGTTPTDAGDVQLFFADDAGEDLIWAAAAVNKDHLRLSLPYQLPVPRDAKLILQYSNPNTVEVSARFLWTV